MSNEFTESVDKKMQEILQEVYIEEDVLKEIVGLFLAIKDGTFPSTRPPRGLLFYGPPGTGKTLLMNTLADKLDLSEPIIIRGPEIISQYYGKSEYRLRQVFVQAKERAKEKKLAIVYIDEIDSLAPRRDLMKGELEQRLVGQLLSLMDGLKKEEKETSDEHVIVIGSTNRPDALDPALRRPGRFDLEIEFDPPKFGGRKEILEIIIGKYAHEKCANISNLDEIAEKTIGFTGADLLQLFNKSSLRAVLDGRAYITQEDLSDVKKNVKPSALREFNMEEPKDYSNLYVCSMDKVPGTDSKRFLRHLVSDHDIDWAKDAKIQKSDDGRNIYLSTDENSARILVDDDAEDMILETSDGKTRNLKVKKIDSKLNIYSNEIVGVEIDKLEQIAKDFSEKRGFKTFLLSHRAPLNNKIASTIADFVRESRSSGPYIVIRSTQFKGRWHGEMERSIRQFFEKVKQNQPCVVYIKNLDVITSPNDENLRGAISELSEQLAELDDDIDTEVLLLGSGTEEIASEIKEEYFKQMI